MVLAKIGFRGTANAGNGGTSVTINVPSGTMKNDVMLAAIWANPIPEPTPDGWIFLGSMKMNVSSASQNVYLRIATGNEPTSYTFPGGPSTFTFGFIDSFYGVDIATPLDVIVPASIDNQAGTTINWSTIIPITDGAWLCAFVADWNNLNDFATPSGYTLRGFGPVNTISSGDWTKMISPPASVTLSTTKTAGGGIGTLIVALRPGPEISYESGAM